MKNAFNFLPISIQDQKELRETNLNSLALIKLNSYPQYIDVDYKSNFVHTCFSIDSLFKKDIKRDFFGETIEDYDHLYDEHMKTCTFLSYGTQYSNLKKYIFCYELPFNFHMDLCEEFYKNYNVEIKIYDIKLDKVNEMYSVTYFYVANRIFFNVYFKSLIITPEIYLIISNDLIIQINIDKK